MEWWGDAGKNSIRDPDWQCGPDKTKGQVASSQLGLHFRYATGENRHKQISVLILKRPGSWSGDGGRGRILSNLGLRSYRRESELRLCQDEGRSPEVRTRVFDQSKTNHRVTCVP